MGEQTQRTSEIIQRIRDFVKQRDVQVDPTEPHAVIDKVQVQQVLFHLLRNGIGHADPTKTGTHGHHQGAQSGGDQRRGYRTGHS
jgi:signal transduction histidine kinase